MSDLLKSETERLETFNLWPKSSLINKYDLAKAGWFYTLHSDRTQCPWCMGILYNWEENDDPFGEHLRHFPSCEFVQNKLFDEQWRDLPCVKAVIDLGYSENIIEKIIFKLKAEGIKNFNSEQIMNKLLKIDDSYKENPLTCKVCFDSTMQELFLPCRHIMCCKVCSQNISLCPLCRNKIVGRLKVFFVF